MITGRRFLATLVLASALACAPPRVAATPTTTDVLVTEAATRFALVSCALRNTGTGWTIINDSGHTPSGCTGIVQHTDHIELQHDVGAVRVSSLTVTVDETYAKAAIRCGASVGFALSRIYLYSGAEGTPALDPATVTAASGNLWVYGLFRL